MTTASGWARPWAIARPFAKPTPRAGAWYPILGDADDQRVVLDVRGRRVAVPRRLLEIRESPPTRFTVVYRSRQDHNPAEGSADDLGQKYAVCPSCGSRLPIYHEPATLMCGTCSHRGEVAYWETG